LKGQKKTPPFRLYIQILIFSALVALGGGILWSLQQVLYGGIVSIRDGLINKLEQQINRKIRYSSISPSIFGSFDVRNVRVMGRDDSPIFTMSRFRINYSLFDLLRGRAQAIRSVRIDSPLVNFDTARDSDLIEMLENLNLGENGSLQNFAEALPEKFVLRIRNGKCLIVNGNDRFDFDGLTFNIGIANKKIDFSGTWGTGIAINRLIGKPVNMRVTARTNGFCRTNMEEGEADFTVSSITGDVLSAFPVSFGLVLSKGAVMLGKKSDLLPCNFFFEYLIDKGNIDSWFNCTNFKFGDFLTFSGGLENARQLLDIAGSGTAYLKRNQDGSLAYSLNMAGESSSDARLPFQPTEAFFEINAAGDEKRIYITKLQLSLPESGEEGAFFYGDLGFSGSLGLEPFAPDGALTLGSFSLSGREGINANIIISTNDNADNTEISAFCESLNVGRIEFSPFSVLLQPLEHKWGFSVLARRANESPGVISLDGTINSKLGNIDAKLRLDTLLVGDISNMMMPFIKGSFNPAPILTAMDSTSITTEVFFAMDSKQIHYSAPSIVLNSKADGGFSGFASVYGTNRHFELANGRIVRGEEVLLVSGNAKFSDPGNFGFSVNAGYRDLSYQIEGEIQNGQRVNIQGPYGLTVKFSGSPSGTYSGFIQAEGFPIPFLGQQEVLTRISLMAQFSYDSFTSWLMNLERFEVNDIASPTGPAQIQVSGTVNQNGADFPVLHYSDSIGPLDGAGKMTWISGSLGMSGYISLQKGSENYRMDGSFADRRLDLNLFGSSMRMDRLLGQSSNILANGNIHLLWDTSDSFRAEGNFSSVNGRVLNQDFRASTRIELNKEELTVNGFKISFAGFEGTVSQFTFNRTNGIARTRAEIKGALKEKKLSGGLSLAASFAPVNSWFETKGLLNSFSGKIHVENLVYGNGQPQSFDFSISRTGNDDNSSLLVTGGPRDMLRLRMDNEGNFYAGFSNPFPVRGSITGSLKNKMIDAYCSDLYVDLAELMKILPDTSEVFVTGGYVNASIEIRGSITDPEFFGTARATSLRLKIPNYIPQELRPIPFSVNIDGNEVRFGPISTSVGRGAGSASGWFLFDRWIPNTFSIDITVPRETPIPYGFDITGFIAHGDVYGNFNVSMEDQALDMTGNLYVNNTELGVSADGIAKAQDSGAFSDTDTHITADLTVTTGPTVEFLYPSSNFPILRANPDIGTKVRITADSLTKQYSVVSDVRIRGGEIFYFERNFYIRSGLLTFRENELQFSPRLTARAEVREHNDNGPVTISMIVDNAPLLSFTARFESTPVLSQMEIFALLGQSMTGFLNDDDADFVQRAFLSSSTDLLAQFTVVRQLEQQIRNFMKLDMFSIRTQALQNFIFTKTGLMNSTVDRPDRIGNYFDNTTVFGGKYIGRDMFIQGMLSMQYDGQNTAFGGLTFKPDIGIELQNPLFSIRWDFAPAHPENWYINDNSITLTWRMTF
jgi:hypothetical protein